MWLAGGPEARPAAGDAVPIRTILGSTAPGRVSRLIGVGARWGVWVLALVAVGAGGYGVWHLLYGDRVSGEVWLGRPPAALATTTMSTTTSTTTTTAPPTTSTSLPGTVRPTTDATTAATGASSDAGSSGPGPGPAVADDNSGPSANAGPGSLSSGSDDTVVTVPSATVDDHGGRSGSSGPGSSGSGTSGSGVSGSGTSGSGTSGSSSSGSGSSGSGSSGSGHDD
jgi:hypothetical protein